MTLALRVRMRWPEVGARPAEAAATISAGEVAFRLPESATSSPEALAHDAARRRFLVG
jgi:hypothetical protein